MIERMVSFQGRRPLFVALGLWLSLWLAAQAQGDEALREVASMDVPLTGQVPVGVAVVRPVARDANVPATRWTHQPRHMLWNRAALSALKTHGQPLVDMVPADVRDWCPAYPEANEAQRRSFWVGFMSALAKYESTYRPNAVGGGGRWYGLLQILPATARGYGCNARSGTALKSGAANLSCAVRIMAVTVPRDGVIYGPNGRGVAADWGPMRSRAKRAEMAGWLKRQSYCALASSVRPRARPADRLVRNVGDLPQQ